MFATFVGESLAAEIERPVEDSVFDKVGHALADAHVLPGVATLLLRPLRHGALLR
jgi:hypothetical protein